MTVMEKVKSTLAERGWEVLIVALLTVIISGLSFFIVKITNIQEDQQKIISRLQSQQILSCSRYWRIKTQGRKIRQYCFNIFSR